MANKKNPSKPDSQTQDNQIKLSPDFSAPEVFQQAMEQHQQGNFSQAEALYRQILQHEPSHPDALHFLGVMAYQLGNYPAAIQLINQALASSPSAAMYSNLALVFQAQGDFEQLIKTYRQALLLENSAAIHCSLANVLAQQGNLQAAVTSYQAALALSPDDFQIYDSLGNVFVGLGNVEAAIDCYRRVISLKPDYGIVHNNLANLLKEQGKLDEALASYHQALTLMPTYARGYHNLAVTLYAQGKLTQAIANYQKSISLEPNYESYYNLGCIFQDQEKLDEAASCFQQSIVLKADFSLGYHNLAVVLQKQEKFDAAIEHYEKAIALNPERSTLYGDLAGAFYEAGNFVKAAENYAIALSLSPNDANHHYNLGKLLKAEGKFDDAIQHCQKAIALKPDFMKSYNELGITWQEKGCYQVAIAVLRQALAYDLRNDAGFNFNLGLMLLSCGQFEEGWQYAEYRYDDSIKSFHFIPPKVLFPQWQGESIAGKSILLWYEQGFGDEIQFCRYVSVLKKMGASYITLACKKPLKPLFETLIGVDRLLVSDEETEIQHHDYWTFLLSLPLHCKTTLESIPVSAQYLTAEPVRVDYWKNKLPKAKMRIGLVWKGSSGHLNDANRSLPHLDKFLPLWTVPDCAFVSLQKGQGEDEVLSLPETCHITHLGSDIQDFADTAAIVSQLDLIICVDTSIAHLAGALGKPVWILLPFIADWRWIINRIDTPWYPKTRLFRQSQRGQWQNVIEQLSSRLKAVMAGDCQVIWPVSDLKASEIQITRAAELTKYNFQTRLALAKQPCTIKDAFPFDTVKAVFVANRSVLALSQWPAMLGYHYAELLDNGICAYPTAPMHYYFKLKVDSKYGKPSLSLLPIVSSYINAGNSFLVKGNLDKAAQNYAMALKFDSNCALAHNSLGVVFQKQGKLHQAIEHYQRALLIKPDYAPVHFNLGIVFDGLQKFDTAIEHYQQALLLDPNYVDARDNLEIALKNQTGRNRAQ